MPISSRRRSVTVDDGMAGAYADQAIHLRDSVPLTEQPRDVTGASQATVAAWLDGIAAPEGAHADA